VSTPAQQLAAFAAGLRPEHLPPDVVRKAGLHALDTIGCGVAAHALDAAPFAIAAAREEAGLIGAGPAVPLLDVAGDDRLVGVAFGPATAIGIAGGLSAGAAALLNGTFCHALDFDDTHPDSVVHVSAAVVPAALAAAQQAGATGADLLCAFVAGNETSTRIGMAAGGRFHARGLHPTGVCGVFGATVAAARARGLDAESTTNALGIAGSFAGGLLEFLADGSKTKPLHAGWAAQSGVAAARLAEHGATGPATVLDGRRGFLATYLHGEEVDVAAQTVDLGERWETLAIAFKPYPACHYVHAPLDALARLVAEHGFGAGDVASVVAISDATGIGLVLDPLADKLVPRTPYDAKFSLPYCLGHLLVHGHVDVTSFTRDAIRDAAVLDVASRVTYERKDYAAAPDAFPGGVRVTLHDGRVLEAELRHQRGGAELPMSEGELLEKWDACTATALPEPARTALAALLRQPATAASLDALAALAAARAA